MNIFNRFTLKSLKKNKTRTIVTIIGIILSTAMICAVTTFASSIQNYLLNNAIYNNGDWHGSEIGTDFSTYQKISSSDKVKTAAYMQRLGYAEAKNSKNEYKPYIYILGAGDNAEETLPIHIISGEFPTYLNEILLPEHLASNGGIKYKIGDTVTLKIGERLLDGHPMNQNNPVYTFFQNGDEVLNEETLDIKYSREFVVSGFYERPGFEPHSAPGYTAIALADKTPPADAQYDIYFKMNKPSEVYDFMNNNGLTGDLNSDVLMFSGTSKYANYDEMIISLAIIIMVLIIFGSVALIYNAFSISVSERTKQFGLLSSVGATKKQLRKMVFFEAFAVSLIGIPLGIISGIGGIGVTLLFIGNKFRSLIESPIDLTLSVSPVSVVLAVVIALVTVLISAWIPSKRATKVSAVEAIRQNNDIKTKPKSVKTSKVMYKLFGLPGMLASKHYKRSKKKYRATVLSLFMSIVLFISASAFTNSLLKASSVGIGTSEIDISYYCNINELKDIDQNVLLENFKNCTSVTSAVYSYKTPIVAQIPKKDISTQGLKRAEIVGVQEDKNANYLNVDTCVCFINDSEFKKLLKENSLDEDVFINKYKPQAIAIDGRTFFDYSDEKYVELKLLKSDVFEIESQLPKDIDGYDFVGIVEPEKGEFALEYSEKETEKKLLLTFEEGYKNLSFNVGDVIYDSPYYVPSGEGDKLVLLYPDSLKTIIFPNDVITDGGCTYDYYFTSNNHEASYKSIKQILVDNKLDTDILYNHAKNAEQDRNVITIIKVFSYGFIVLISLIAVANVFNTISTNISLRRREFAMLKSVGMTKKGFNRMMSYECLLYGTKALLYGIPVSIGITVLIWVALNNGFETGFSLPWSAIGIAVLSVFTVVFVTMLYSMSKIKKENPIDALKNENL